MTEPRDLDFESDPDDTRAGFDTYTSEDGLTVWVSEVGMDTCAVIKWEDVPALQRWLESVMDSRGS